ncbi:MAG TPA: alpha/beta hydrolase [Candidatus Baltobacteraceae bacterium]
MSPRLWWTTAFYAWAMVATIVLSPRQAASADGLPLRPPNGTYTYQLRVGQTTVGKSVIAIDDTAPGSIVVSENAALGSITAVTSMRYDAATLAERGFTGDGWARRRAQHGTATVAGTSLTASLNDQNWRLNADPSAPLLLFSDRLIGTQLLIPAILHATAAAKYSLASIGDDQVAVGTVTSDLASVRPSGVPVTDSSKVVDFSSVREIFWFDPNSYVVDEIDLPTQREQISLIAREPSVQAFGTAAPFPTAIPLAAGQFSSQDIAFASADGTALAGTLTVPTQGTPPFAAVALVAGRGANRDVRVGPNSVFLQLGTALSNGGIVVLRYDERGVGRSGGSFKKTTRAMLVADAAAAFAFLQHEAAVDPKRVYLLGHGQGGELVPTVAASEPQIAGIILMAAPAVPFSQVRLEQALEGVPPDLVAATKAHVLHTFDEIRSGERRTPGDAWVRSTLDVDPTVDIQRVHSPILILAAADDVQVLPHDLPRLINAAKSANHDVTATTFPNDNHLFMPVTPGEPLTLFAAQKQYVTVAGLIDPHVVDALLAWLARRD